MQSIQPPSHPQMVLFVVDGMRPDGMQQARTPAMDRIMQQGSYSLNAQTTFPTVTLPCHTSLFHSVPPERHGILTNTWVPQVRPVPGLFDVLHQAGKVAASFYMALDSIFYRGMLLGRTATVARWTLLKEFVPKIRQVTREQIREVAKKYLVANNLTVGTLVPIKSAKAPTGRSHPAKEIR